MQKTEKIYDLWNEKKKSIDLEITEYKKIIQNGEFWTFTLGVNVGGEMSVNSPFTRPCLILNAKLPGDMVLICPTSTQFGDGYMKQKFYQEIEDYQKYGLQEKSYLVLNQIRFISKKRLISNITENLREQEKFPKFPAEEREKIKIFFKENFLRL